jgi:hypothetical protein
MAAGEQPNKSPQITPPLSGPRGARRMGLSLFWKQYPKPSGQTRKPQAGVPAIASNHHAAASQRGGRPGSADSRRPRGGLARHGTQLPVASTPADIRLGLPWKKPNYTLSDDICNNVVSGIIATDARVRWVQRLWRMHEVNCPLRSCHHGISGAAD